MLTPNFTPAEAILTSIDEISEDDGDSESNPQTPQRQSTEDSEYLPTANSPAEMFTRFITQLGPSMVKQLILIYVISPADITIKEIACSHTDATPG